MAVYRYQVTSASYWRGKIKRWSTTWHTSTPNDTNALRNLHQSISYPNPGDVTGACSGGVASIAVYEATGGPPIAETVYFDWESPSTWIPYNGSVWSELPEDTPLDGGGESALLIVGHLPGLSSTGKPVTTRKYFHAVPSRTSVDFADPDVPAGVITKVTNAIALPYMSSPSGVVPLSISAEDYYFSHQRVRGRRRPRSQDKANAFSAGVVVGADAATSGGGSF